MPEDTLSQRTIEVWNKIDRVPQREVLELMHDAAHDAEVRREWPPTCSPPGLTACSVRAAQASVAVSPQTVVPVLATEGTGEVIRGRLARLCFQVRTQTNCC